MRRLTLVLLLAGCSAPAPPPDPQIQENIPVTESLQGRSLELLAEADETFSARKYGEASPIYKLAAEAAERGGDVGTEVEALAQVARCYSIQGAGKEQGEAFLRRAADKAHPEHPRGWTRYLGVAGIYERERGDKEEAKRLFVEMYEFALAHDLPLRAIDAAHHVAIVASPEEQVEWARKGIAAAEEAESIGWLAVLWNNLGATYEDQQDYAQAVAAYTKAREYHHQGKGEVPKLAADWALGHAYRLNGQLPEARGWLEGALAWAERRYAAGPGKDTAEWVGYCLQDLGELLVAEEKQVEGLAKLEAAREKWIEAGLDEHWAEGFQKLEARISELQGE